MFATTENLKVSLMAETLIASEIIRIAAEINEKIKQGEKIYNFTIGDFDPKIFPIPAELETEIVAAYHDKQTNYPPANGILELRKSVSTFLQKHEGLTYTTDDILISAGARPLIHATYTTLLDAGDTVLFPVPSWNNNHYCHMASAKAVFVETSPDNFFMPSAGELAPYIKDAAMISLCSPLNPTGTVFTRSQLESICDLVLEENKRREGTRKPLYVMYDQIYWMLTFGESRHYNPVSLRPEMKNYTIFIDGISKSLAATGVRVGWAFGPANVIDKMKSILSHVGAWAPKAEQVATAKYLGMDGALNSYIESFKSQISQRLEYFHKGFRKLREAGFKVDVIAPQAAIYFTVKLDLCGSVTQDGRQLTTQADVTRYLLDEARLALVPFYAFGSPEHSSWYRLSVGTCNLSEADNVMNSLRAALLKLTSQ
ncbi:MAG TPA: aminotransferase class I/II-fold pyridoxal phosphate-dependent enzyme [Bacteroidia bacterium]|nr:aminotransferase class I/II-fold pyridoxal phosphate-dependent enzyme [Bacteroidia bacterium]